MQLLSSLIAVSLLKLSAAYGPPSSDSSGSDTCNPAHEYPAGQCCDGKSLKFYSCSGSAATPSAYTCNPAHEYPAGQCCDGQALTLYSCPASTATTSPTPYTCNPAHEYPAGQCCDGKALTLYSCSASSTTTIPPATSSAETCNPAHQYPAGQCCDGKALTFYSCPTPKPYTGANSTATMASPTSSVSMFTGAAQINAVGPGMAIGAVVAVILL